MSSIIVVGVNHTTAPVEMREKMALRSDKMKEVLAILHDYVGPAVVLSTCNRTEIYSMSEDPLQDSQKLVNFLSNYHRLPREEFTSRLYTYVHESAIRHLFQVASGIDSMILGEEQILSQVRRALQLAEDSSHPQRPLAYIFRQAVRAGKRARHETAISRSAISVSHASVELAQKALGDLSRCTVLIVSAGEAGKLTGKIIRDSGVGSILVTNRTYERAVALAQKLGGRAVPFPGLAEALAQADIVISSTNAPGFVLTPLQVAQALAQRLQRPLCLIDIAVPRDIDPEVRKLPGVFLYDIDDLESFSNNSLSERRQEARKVEAIIDEEVARALRWWNMQEVLAAVAALRQRAEAIRQKELARTLKKLPNLSPEEQARLEALTRAVVNKLLHNPTVCLKDGDSGHRYLPTVRELFDLKES